MPLCARCGQDNPDIAKFCLACGAPLAAPEPPAEERKLITVLFCDIVGSTATAESLDPEDVRARLAPYYERARAELERFGGTVEKFIGDAVVALFGAPVAHEDDPERAVRAAFAVRNAVQSLNEEDAWLDLKIRVGVNTGEALVVLGARTTEGEGMASGDVMNTAARLQSAAPVDGIVVGELTHDATRQAIDYRECEPVAAKGKSEPLVVWEAIEARDAFPRPTTERPLVGRDTELRELEALWEDIRRTRTPAHATIVGPPGIGKSRLVEELGRQLAGEATVLWGRCLPYGEGITYWPVADILKAAAGILQSDDAETASAQLGALLERLATDDPDELRTMATAASNLLGTATTPRGTYTAAAIAQAELHWGIRRLLHLLAHERPLIIVFEDLHWAEPTLFELLQFLVAPDSDVPLLVIGTARPELGDTEPALLRPSPRAPVLTLDALPDAAGEALLASLLGDAAPADDTRAALLRNAGGNPLFLEETVRMLADSGLPDEDLAQLPVPTSLQSLIAARLDQLPASQKQVGQHAAVVGRVFWPGAVAHLRANGNAPDAAMVSTDLVELERRDFIHAEPTSSVAGEREYAFKHILIRDVAYGQLPKGRRIGLHVRFADWVEGLPAGEEEFVEIVAWHLEQACLLGAEVARAPVPLPVEPAMRALAAAAEKAERREGIREARRFYTRALALAGAEESATALELRLRRARAAGQLGELRLACEELEQLTEEAIEARPDVRCLALITLSNIAQRQGHASDARSRLEQAGPLAEELGDQRLQVLARFSSAALDGDFAGDFPRAVAQLEEAVAVAEEMDDTPLRVEAHLRLGFLLSNMGELAAAEEELVRCIELAKQLGSRRDEARAAFQLGLVKYYRGDVEEALRLNLQAREWLERTAESYFQIQNFRALGLYALARGDAEEAESWLRQAVPLALEEGGWLVLELYRYLVDALLRQGRDEDARELVAFASRSIPEEDAYARATVLVAAALAAAASGDHNAATASFEEALRLLEEQQLPIELGEARLALARALHSFGEETGARVELERARGIFKRLDAPGLVAEIDEELAKLASGTGATGPTRMH